jgi:hypothetical protein
LPLYKFARNRTGNHLDYGEQPKVVHFLGLDGKRFLPVFAPEKLSVEEKLMELFRKKVYHKLQT